MTEKIGLTDAMKAELAPYKLTPPFTATWALTAAPNLIACSTYIMDYNNGFYEARNGLTGGLVYGGAYGAGGVSGSDASAVEQACIDALEAAGTPGRIIKLLGVYVQTTPRSINGSVEISGEAIGGDLYFENDNTYHGFSDRWAVVDIADGIDDYRIGDSAFVFGVTLRNFGISGFASEAVISNAETAEGTAYSAGAGVRVYKGNTLHFRDIQVRRKKYGFQFRREQPVSWDNVIDVVDMENIYTSYCLYGMHQTGWLADLRIRNMWGYINQRSLIFGNATYGWMIEKINSNADGWNSTSVYDAPISIGTNRDVTMRDVRVQGQLGVTLCPVPLMTLTVGIAGDSAKGNNNISAAIAGGTATAIVTEDMWEANDYWNGYTMVFTTGALIGESKLISDWDKTAQTFTTAAFSGAPSAGDQFILVNVSSLQNEAGGDETHTVDATLTEGDDTWNGYYIYYQSGANKGHARLITDFDAASDTLVHETFPAAAAVGDYYVILEEWNRSYIQVDNPILQSTLSCAIAVSGEQGRVEITNPTIGPNSNTATQDFVGGSSGHVDGPAVEATDRWHETVVNVTGGRVLSQETTEGNRCWFNGIISGKIKDVGNYSPYGVITNPFLDDLNNAGFNVIGMYYAAAGAGQSAVPTASKDYTVVQTDVFVTSTGGADVSITIKDSSGATVAAGMATLTAQPLPVGYKINWGAWTGAPTVVVSAL